MKQSTVLSRLAMTMVALSWGLAIVAVKYLLLHGWSQTQVVMLRIIIPGLVLSPLALQSILRHWGQPQIKRLPWLILLGLFTFFIAHFATVWGQQRTTAAVTGLLSVTSPLTALFLSAGLKYDRLSWIRVGGAFLGVCGVAVVVLLGSGPAEISIDHLSGPLLIIAGAAIWGTYHSLIGAFYNDFTPLEVSALTVSWPAILVLAPAIPVLKNAPWSSVSSGVLAAGTNLPGLDLPAMLAILWFGVIAGGLAVFLLGYAVKHLGTVSATSFLYLNPVFSLLGARLILGETITPWLLTGAALILGGLYFANRRPA